MNETKVETLEYTWATWEGCEATTSYPPKSSYYVQYCQPNWYTNSCQIFVYSKREREREREKERVLFHTKTRKVRSLGKEKNLSHIWMGTNETNLSLNTTLCVIILIYTIKLYIQALALGSPTLLSLNYALAMLKPCLSQAPTEGTKPLFI